MFGDYEDTGSLKITHGYSKDKRPDLKQFMISMLCVDRNIPIIGKTVDSNASDKTLNNELLSNISPHMAEHGFKPGASIYIADSAFVTSENLAKAVENDIRFLSRLPAYVDTTYSDDKTVYMRYFFGLSSTIAMGKIFYLTSY